MSNDIDACVPKVLNDFVFDLYDSVTTSQLAEEQSKLYNVDFRDLHGKYFQSQPWPSPQSIASECNGHPLFLAVYRELTHRQWHAVSRPTIRDRMEGWNVYRELFEEIIESDGRFYLLPSWCFDILHEFVYQFQGYSQVRSAVYASARKHHLLDDTEGGGDGSGAAAGGGGGGPSNQLVENLHMLQNSDAWEAESVFGYLHRLVQLGFPSSPDDTRVAPVYTNLGIFASVALSRLECLLGDYTSCLQALTPLIAHGDYTIPKEDAKSTVEETLQSVVGARISLSYHAGVSFLMLRRYKDALKTLGDICAYLQRGFKTGLLRKLPSFDQFQKQYDRMLSLLVILTEICPSANLVVEDSVRKAMREKYGARVEASTSYEEFFLSPKFIACSPSHVGLFHRQQVQMFLYEMQAQPAFRKLRSYLKLYTSLPVSKLATFHDLPVAEFIPILLSFKARMLQVERDEESNDTYVDGTRKTALDIHFYLTGENCHVDEAEKQRRFETYFAAQISQNSEIQKEALSIDTKV